jgi:hypothetical protein
MRLYKAHPLDNIVRLFAAVVLVAMIFSFFNVGLNTNNILAAVLAVLVLRPVRR